MLYKFSSSKLFLCLLYDLAKFQQPQTCISRDINKTTQKAKNTKSSLSKPVALYIDFSDLPPAKGRGRQAPQVLEGQVVVVQAADLVQSRRIIPDLATWTQCYALYVTVLTQSQPERLPELMAYQSLIAKTSLKYKWPAWVVYDQYFRSEMAGKVDQSWARVDPGSVNCYDNRTS